MLCMSRVARAQGARETRSRNDDESYWSVRRGGVTTSWAAIPLRPQQAEDLQHVRGLRWHGPISFVGAPRRRWGRDRKSTRLNSSHGYISYAVFCLKKKKKKKKKKQKKNKIKKKEQKKL